MLIVIGLLFFLIGLGVFAGGIVSVFKVRRQLADSAKAAGTIVDFGKVMGKSGYLYCPQVSFLIPSGQTIRFQSETGTQPPAYTVGQQVRVVYQRNSPQCAEIDSLMAVWLVPGCMLVMSLGFGVLGLMLFGIGALITLNN